MPKEESSASKKIRKKSEQQNTFLSAFLRLSIGKNKKIALLCQKIAKESNWKLQHMSKKSPGKGEKGIRATINKEALSALKSNKPRLCIRIIDTYFKYYSNNLHGRLIKAEASHALHRNNDALKSLKKILTKKNNKFQDKSLRLCKSIFAEEASELEHKKIISPTQAIEYYFNHLIKLNIVPTYDKGLNEILEKINPVDEEVTLPELQEHNLILKFNTEVVRLFEKKLIKRLS
jgi:hypothetical protein